MVQQTMNPRNTEGKITFELSGARGQEDELHNLGLVHCPALDLRANVGTVIDSEMDE